MDTLMTAFEVISLTAIGGSVLAMGLFEIADAIGDHRQLGQRLVRIRRTAPRLRLLTSAKPAPASVESAPLAKAA